MMKKKIIVVEDDTDISKGITILLNAEGYNVISINENFKNAINLIIKENPQLILMDIQLTNISGIEIIRQLKLSPYTTQTPIITLTALTQKKQINKIMQESGCNGYLPKPFLKQELINIIELYIQ
jgi:DNA-binding response OmpR family regulator